MTALRTNLCSEGQRETWSGTNNESGLDSYARYDCNFDRDTHPVGQKGPNALGLPDMTGNVMGVGQRLV